MDFCLRINKFLGCSVFLVDDCLFDEVRFFFCVFLLLAGFVTERGICEMGVVSSLLLVQSMVKLHIGLREGPRDGVLSFVAWGEV